MNIRLIQSLLGIAFLAGVINIYLSYNSRITHEANTRDILRSYELTARVNYLLSLLKDAETGQRGYLLTGKAEYKDPFLEALAEIDLQMRLLLTDTQEDAVEYPLSKELDRLAKAKIEELNLNINLYDKKDKDSVLKVITSDRGQKIMSQASVVVKKIVSHSNEKLTAQKDKQEKTDQLSYTLRYCNMAFICLILLTAFVRLGRQHKKINTLVSSLQAEKLSLEKEVQLRTQELHVANEELQAANEEMHTANDALQSVNEQLNAINEEKNKFIGMAAHDLKSPINSIKGLVQLFQAESKNLTDEQQEYLRYMNQSTGRMIQMIADILNVNKIEEGKQVLKLEKFNLFHFVEDLVFGLKVTAEKKNIRIFLNATDENLVVNSDKNAIAQVVENLISNAVKFSPADRNVYVSLFAKEPGWFVVQVKDEGQGIPEAELPQLFEKFKKLSTRPTAGEDSTGLGLSIVKSLVESLGGSIRAESKPRAGATFIVELPVN